MKLILAVLALISVGLAAADCPKAADWARAFYSEHYSFYAEPSDISCSSPRQSSVRCSRGNGHIRTESSDIWITIPGLEARTEKIGKPVRFSVETESPDSAIVSMSYPFVLDSKRPPERHTVHLVLRKREHECWQLQDFITPRGDSLAYMYLLPQP